LDKQPYVLVAGFFDLLHSGHIRFLEEASQYGRVIVSLGSDANSQDSKGKTPVCSENERQYMLQSVRYVHKALVSPVIGPFSFEAHIEEYKPRYFIINRDGHTPQKQQTCEKHGVSYVVLERLPKANFTPRSSTDMREVDCIPHRLDIGGGFLDQRMLNGRVPGPAIIANIETMDCVDRAGMSSSTRNVIHELYGNQLPRNHSEQELANIILAYENFHQDYVSGATDAYGLVFSSVCRFEFDDSYRPHAIEKIADNATLCWLEQHLFLKLTHPRPDDYRVFDGRESFPEDVLKEYVQLASETWRVIKARDLAGLKACVNKTCRMQQTLIPGYVSDAVAPELDALEAAGHGAKLMGAGGAGYVMIVADEPPEGSERVVIRRESLNL
jgi:cytidyltransferase-like protein